MSPSPMGWVAGAASARDSSTKGLPTAVAIPALFVDERLAILEFLSVNPVEPTDELMRALTGIGHEVGHFFADIARSCANRSSLHVSSRFCS